MIDRLLQAQRARIGLCTLVALVCVMTGLRGCALPAATHAQRAQAAPLAAAAIAGKVLYVQRGELWLRQGTSDRQFTRAGGIAMQPAWSPDGSSIAYVLRHRNASDLAIMAADGSGTRLITNNDSPIVDSNVWAFSPAWSPDGKQLAYLTDRGRGGGVIDLAVWLINPVTKQARAQREPAPYSGGDADPVWRPGHPDELLYTHYFYAENAQTAYAQIILYNTVTGHWDELTPPIESSFQPAWSPKGDTVVFVKRGQEHDDLYGMKVPDALPEKAAPLASTLLLAGVMAQPVFSPTGDQLLYIGEGGDSGFDLWTVGITTGGELGLKGKPVQVTSHQQVDATSRPSWIP